MKLIFGRETHSITGPVRHLEYRAIGNIRMLVFTCGHVFRSVLSIQIKCQIVVPLKKLVPPVARINQEHVSVFLFLFVTNALNGIRRTLLPFAFFSCSV